MNQLHDNRDNYGRVVAGNILTLNSIVGVNTMKETVERVNNE